MPKKRLWIWSYDEMKRKEDYIIIMNAPPPSLSGFDPCRQLTDIWAGGALYFGGALVILYVIWNLWKINQRRTGREAKLNQSVFVTLTIVYVWVLNGYNTHLWKYDILGEFKKFANLNKTREYNNIQGSSEHYSSPLPGQSQDPWTCPGYPPLRRSSCLCSCGQPFFDEQWPPTIVQPKGGRNIRVQRKLKILLCQI